MNSISNEIILSLGVKPEWLTDSPTFINAAREGIPGGVVKRIVKAFDNRDLVVRVLDVSSANLSRIYRVKHMTRLNSEEVLDLLRVYRQAIEVFGDKEVAVDWTKTPIPSLSGERPEDLFDTFEGRKWVSEVLKKIEYGEFS